MSRRAKLESMLEDDPNDPFLHYAIASEFLSEGDREKGLARLTQMLEDFPDYVAGWFRRGQVLAELQRVDEAKAILTHGIEVARQVGDAHAAGEMTELLATLA